MVVFGLIASSFHQTELLLRLCVEVQRSAHNRTLSRSLDSRMEPHTQSPFVYSTYSQVLRPQTTCSQALFRPLLASALSQVRPLSTQLLRQRASGMSISRHRQTTVGGQLQIMSTQRMVEVLGLLEHHLERHRLWKLQD